jgi:signal transduction histidine kinase/ActR/RegA family two-component response regulator
LADWRAATLKRLSRLLVVIAAPIVAFVALTAGAFDLGDRLVMLAIPAGLIIVAALANDPRRTRVLAMAIVGIVSVACLALVARLGVTPTSLLGLGAALVVVAIFFGKTNAWAFAIASTLLIVMLGGAAAAGLLHPAHAATLYDWTKLGTWLRLAAGYFAAMSVLASAVATLIARLEDDIRERDRLLAAEREARAAAEVANRLKDQFLSTVSHELRTPLNAIAGWARILRSGALAEERRDHALAVIMRNAGAQEKLIADLLDVSRITSGRLSLDLAIVSPTDIVRMSVEAVKLAADAKQVQLVVAHEDAIPSLRGDTGRLQQVVVNLLTNAVKFSPKGGRVEVGVARDSCGVAIAVRDQGEGIAPSFMPHLFTPFRQADEGIARSKGGLGLGLTIAKGLVEQHGGSIEVHSEGVGRGATFVVRLPSRLTPSEARVPAAAPPSGACLPGGRELFDVVVLLVEDDADARELLVEVLEGRGARVRAAASGVEAIRHFGSQRPHVIVSDIGLPGQDGLALIAELRERHGAKGVPAVALSAFVRAQDGEQALAAGFDAHVPKPVDVEQLVDTVVRLAQGQRPAP